MEQSDFIGAIDYIEDNLSGHINYEEAAFRAYMSSFHFQKMFSLVFGITLGDYIRRRRLSLAGVEIARGAKIIDVAFKYGYDTHESFLRAFKKYHGILPSAAKRGAPTKVYPRLSLNNENKGNANMECKIVQKDELTLVGYKKRFTGVPYGEERLRQENDFICSTRAKQWLLLGASCNPSTDYGVVMNVDGDGYDYYVAYELDEWTRKSLFDKNITGIDLSTWGLEIINIPKQTYAVFATEKMKYPIAMYTELREKIASDWLKGRDFEFINAPEVVALCWRDGKKEDWAKERHIEIMMPIKLKSNVR